MKNKIFFISTNDHVPWGGSEVLWSLSALRFLNEGKFEVFVDIKKWPQTPSHIQKILSEGGTVLFREARHKNSLIWRLARRLLPSETIRQWEESKKMNYWNGHKPDLAILSMGNHNSSGEWMEYLSQNKIPFVLIVQLVKDGDSLANDSDEYKRLKEGYLKASRIYCVSHDNKRILQKQFADELKNACIIFNPFRAPSHPIPFPSLENEVNLAVVASLNSNHKGQDLILELLRNSKWQKRNIKVNFYGDGPHKENLSNLVKLWHLEEKVSLCGFEPDIEKIWFKNHALLLPSRMEGLSLALLEAIMHERITITTKVGDSERLIADNETGFLIKGPTMELIDEALERAWKCRDQWSSMAENAKQKALSYIPEDPIGDFCEDLENLLQELLPSK